MINMNQERVKLYIGDLRQERRYWARMLKGKSYNAILNQTQARIKVSTLDFAIRQANYWLKEIK